MGELALVESRSGDETSLSDEAGNQIMLLRPLPRMDLHEPTQPTTAFLAALHTMGLAAPGVQAAIRQAADAGHGLSVVFPPAVALGLRNGSLHLLETSTGTMATAVNASGHFVAHGRVVGDAATAGTLAAGATAGAVAIAVLPVLIASAAAYAQHRQLEKSLASIKAVVERIEERLEDTDSGVCDAAEGFLALVEDSIAEGGLTEYLRLELASQRTAVEALYSARRRWVTRFKHELEHQQVEREKSKGRGQPWVDAVAERVKAGKFEQELILFIRALLCRTKLNVLAAVALAEEGRGGAAMRLIGDTERELRQEFFDLHNRLVPLARIAPEPSLMQKVPGMGRGLQQAYETVKTLVEHLDTHVLPTIPDPDNEREVRATLTPETVAALAAAA